MTMENNMDTNFAHLMLLYDEVYKTALKIKEMIDQNELDELNILIGRQGQQIQKIADFEKHFDLNIEQLKEKKEAKSKVALMQKENIEFLKQKQQEVRKNLNNTSKDASLKNAYIFKEDHVGSGIDIRGE